MAFDRTDRDELTPSQRYWLTHLEAAERTGISLREYADNNGLEVQSLYTGKHVLKRLGAWPVKQAEISLCRAEVVESTPRGRDVESNHGPINCRVHLPNGVMVELASTEALSLVELLTAAGSLS